MLDYSKCQAVGDNLLVKYTLREEIGGVRIPQQCVEAKLFDVISVGPEVTRCKVGDRIMPIGVMGQTWGFAPGTHEFIVMKNECVAMILDKASMEVPPPIIQPTPEPEKYIPETARN